MIGLKFLCEKKKISVNAIMLYLNAVKPNNINIRNFQYQAFPNQAWNRFPKGVI